MDYVLTIYCGKPRYYDFFIPDPGLAKIAALLDQEGFIGQIVDLNVQDVSFDRFVDQVVEHQPLFVGFKLFSNGFEETLDLAKRIKERCSNIKILMGGPAVAFFKEKLFGVCDAIDIAVVGESEHMIVNLANAIRDGKSISDIPNLIFREGGSIKTTPRKFVEDLDRLPLQDLKKFDLEKYWPMVNLNMLRGCYFDCAFCIHTHIWGKGVRVKSLDRIMKDVENTLDHGIKLFRISDSTPPPGLQQSFCKEIIDRGLDIKWCGFARSDLLDDEYLKLAKESGCVSLFFGSESGNDNVLNAMNKRTNRQMNIDIIKKTNEYGIKTVSSIIVGFPGETDESVKDTISMIHEAQPTSVTVCPFILMPDTPVAINPERYGVTFRDDWQKKLMQLRPDMLFRPEFYEDVHYWDCNGVPNHHWVKKSKEVSDAIKDVCDVNVSDHAYLLAEALGMDGNQFWKDVYRVINQDTLEEFNEKYLKNLWTNH